jgi:hypothetical protein
MVSGYRSRSLYDRYMMPSSARHLLLRRVCAPHPHTSGCGRLIVPSCTARTASYHVHLVCKPLFPARRTVLYCHPTSVFSKYPYSKVWPDDSSFFICKYGVLLLSFSVYTSNHCTKKRAIISSVVRIFKIYHAKILRKIKIPFSTYAVT